MPFNRREFMLASAAAGLVAAVPGVAGAEAGDSYTLDPADPDHQTIVSKSLITKAKPSGQKHITFTKTINFEKPDSLGELLFGGLYPQNGTATVTIDADGSWQCRGSFPAQPRLIQKNLTMITFATQYVTTIKNNAPYQNNAYLPGPTFAIAIPVYAIVDKNGGTWNRSGKSDLLNLDRKEQIEFSSRWFLKTRPLKASETVPSLPNANSCGDFISSLMGSDLDYLAIPTCL